MKPLVRKRRLDPKEARTTIHERNARWEAYVCRGAELLHPRSKAASLGKVKAIEAAVGRSAARLGNAGNRHLRSIYETLLLRAMKPMFHRAEPKMRPRFVTVITRKWDVSDLADGFNHHAIKVALSRLLGRCHWVGVIEIVRINNARGPNGRGKRICVHVHLLVWSDDMDRLRRSIKRRAAGWPGGVFGAGPVTFRKVPDDDHLAFRVAYLMKMPIGAKRVAAAEYIDADGVVLEGQYTKSDVDPVFRAIARKFILLDQYRLRDLICCGGDGRKLIRKIERSIRSRFPLNKATRRRTRNPTR